MDISKLKPKDLEKIFLDGISPEPQNLIGRWKGIFLPFTEKSIVPLKRISNYLVKNTWGRLWKGKDIFVDDKTSRVKGVNIVSPSLRVLKFDVKKIKSRVDSGYSVEFDYSGNIPPFNLIRDEVRFVKGENEQKLIGIMFLEMLSENIPVIFFGLERL